jgi:hypothetical protein
LRQQRRHHPCQDIARPACRHPRVARRVDKKCTVGSGDNRPSAFEDDDGVESFGSMQSDPDPIPLHFLGRRFQQRCHFTWVRRQNRQGLTLSEQVGVPCERYQSIGVNDHRLVHLGDELADESLCPLVAGNPTTDSDDIRPFKARRQCIEGVRGNRARFRFRQRKTHHFQRRRFGGEVEALGQGDLRQTRATAQCRFARQKGSARHAGRTADDQHPPIVALVGVGMAGRQHACHQLVRRHEPADVQGGKKRFRDAQRTDEQIADIIGSGEKHQAQFDSAQRHRRINSHRHATHFARVAVDA